MHKLVKVRYSTQKHVKAHQSMQKCTKPHESVQKHTKVTNFVTIFPPFFRILNNIFVLFLKILDNFFLSFMASRWLFRSKSNLFCLALYAVQSLSLKVQKLITFLEGRNVKVSPNTACCYQNWIAGKTIAESNPSCLCFAQRPRMISLQGTKGWNILKHARRLDNWTGPQLIVFDAATGNDVNDGRLRLIIIQTDEHIKN
jgi:hypothetical protein